jgi:hypothetical protein
VRVLLATVLLALAAPAAGAAEVREHWLGPSFEELALTDHEGGFFFYGECEAPCMPPLQVENDSICERHPLEIDRWARIRRVRGVPAADYGGRLEILTGATTVVIHGDDEERPWRAAQVVRPADGPDAPAAELAAPRVPRWVLRELALVRRVHAQTTSPRALRRRLGVGMAGVRLRLAFAAALGDAALAGVRPAGITPGGVLKDRSAYLERQELGVKHMDRRDRTRARRHAARVQRCRGA